jgi:hypothetical protein
MRYRRCSSCGTGNEALTVDGNHAYCDWCLIARQDARQAMREEAALSITNEGTSGQVEVTSRTKLRCKNQVPQEVTHA